MVRRSLTVSSVGTERRRPLEPLRLHSHRRDWAADSGWFLLQGNSPAGFFNQLIIFERFYQIVSDA